MRTHKKVINMLVIVIVIFAVCWIPYHVLFLYLDETGFSTTKEQTILALFFQWLMYANSACNPIVYAVCNLNYRREFMDMIKCIRESWSTNIICTGENTVDQNLSIGKYSKQ